MIKLSIFIIYNIYFHNGKFQGYILTCYLIPPNIILLAVWAKVQDNFHIFSKLNQGHFHHCILRSFSMTLISRNNPGNTKKRDFHWFKRDFHCLYIFITGKANNILGIRLTKLHWVEMKYTNFWIWNLNNSKGVQCIGLKWTLLSSISKELSNNTKYIGVWLTFPTMGQESIGETRWFFFIHHGTTSDRL